MEIVDQIVNGRGFVIQHMIELLDLIDWTFDAGALLVSLLIAKMVLDLSYREIVTATACLGVYALHEIWESGIIFSGSHREVELWILRFLGG